MIVAELKDAPPNAILHRKRDDGQWDVYMPGDELPADFVAERQEQHGD